jgi:prolyl oligopeptidase
MRLTLAAAAALLLTSTAMAQTAPADDPHVWLEEIEGAKALEWAKAENARSLGQLQGDPRYEKLHADITKIVHAKDRIPLVQIRPDGLHNFWQDDVHVRGLWRRTNLASYRTAEPKWETILDIDALAKTENANWVYQGAQCLPPEETRCLVTLSNGGKDAAVLREFDVRTKQFVPGGFNLPEAKQNVAWLDRDTLLVAREWGPGTLTKSGYPFVVKKLKRGQTLEQAETVFRGSADDVRVFPMVLRDGRGVVHGWGVGRAVGFFDNEYHLLSGKAPVKLSAPLKSSPSGIVDGRLLWSIREDWTAPGGAAFKQGSLLSYDLAEFKRSPLTAKPSLVFLPGPRQSQPSVATTRNKLILSYFDNVKGEAHVLDYVKGGWKSTQLNLPKNATVGVSAASDEDDTAMFTVTSYLTPTTLWLADAATGKLEQIKASPERFNASGHMVEQFEATSKDGVKIPYFVVRPKNAPMNGSTPTLLYSYGGFQSGQFPGYSAGVGKLWLERGGAYVVANIRGGGEFGPSWHQTAQKANKQRTWDDFVAVADDVITRKLTSPRRLGIMGGSQGGLLVGTAMTQRPELFNAVVVQVPLFDMLRYHKMGAGASWIGEYGDPEKDVERAWIAGYSPYQLIKPGVKYPEPFFLTSTKDDRVHPGHARKAAARMAEYGYPYYYYENTDGGHAAAANLKETAKRQALEYTYLHRKLMD